MDARNSRRGGRPRGRLGLASIEALERREVLSYSALGVSLPDLTIKGYSGPVAAYGSTLSVTVDVFNQGASSLIEPTNLDQLAPSSADSAPTSLNVYLTTRPGGGKVDLIGTLAVPAVQQNSAGVITQSILLPSRPKGFPTHGTVYLAYQINPSGNVLESDFTNNGAVSINPVKLAVARPNLQVIGFDAPTSLVPGETISPSIRIANLGAAASTPTTVEIVASQDTNFGPGDKVLATYTLPSVPALSNAPSYGPVLGDANLVPGSNIGTLSGLTFTLPASPKTYFLGVKVDPFHKLVQAPPHNSAQFDVFQKVGPPNPFQSPTLLIPTNGTGVTPPVFPLPLTIGTGVPTTTPPTTIPILTTNSVLLQATTPLVSPSSGGGVVVKDGVSLGAIGSAQARAIRGVFRANPGIFSVVSTPRSDQGQTLISTLDTSPQTGVSVQSQSKKGRLSASTGLTDLGQNLVTRIIS